MKLKNLIPQMLKENNFDEILKMDDVSFVKYIWKMELPELGKLSAVLEKSHKYNKDMQVGLKGPVKSLYKMAADIDKSRIEFIYDIINSKKNNEPIPDWALKENVKYITEDAISAAKAEYEKGKDFHDFLVETAEDSNVDEKYIDLYKEVTGIFQYLTWLELYNKEYPNVMPKEKYLAEKAEYEKTLDVYTGRY